MARFLNVTDALICSFLIFLSLLGVLCAALVPYWRFLIVINLCVAAYALLVAYLRHKTANVLLRWLHDWNSIPLLIFCFKEVYYLIRPIYGGTVYDGLLMAIDRRLFGVDPIVWLAGFTNPYLTETLQVAYSFFYIFFLIIGYEIYRRNNAEQFSRLRFAIAYGFILSYLGYLLVPAVGPRFKLYDYARIDSELPGVVFTPYLRWFLDSGDSIPIGASNVVASTLAQRDAFPSGHTMMTLVLIALGFQWQTRCRYFLLAAGSLLIVATVYLRYHYVIDVLAGALFALFCIRTTHGFCMFLRTRLRLES